MLPGTSASTLALIPGFELSGYVVSDRPVPEGVSRYQDPSAWARYHRACLADAGIVGLTEVVEGAGLWRLDELGGDGLRGVVERAVADLAWPPDVPAIAEYVAASDGGFVLATSDEIVVEPGCCCALDSLREWVAAASGDEWMEVWGGHDVRRLQLRSDGRGHLYRVGPPSTTDAWGEPRVMPPGALASMLAHAADTLARLTERIVEVVPAGLDAPTRLALARMLAGLGD